LKLSHFHGEQQQLAAAIIASQTGIETGLKSGAMLTASRTSDRHRCRASQYGSQHVHHLAGTRCHA